MSMPGWYPDPAGNQGLFRYWDGQGWSETTTRTPGSTPPPMSRPGGSGPGEKRSPLVAVMVGALVLVLAVVVAVWLRSRGGGTAAQEDTNSSTPTVKAWDETSTPSAEPTTSDEPTSGGGKYVACPVAGGGVHASPGDRISGGGLSFARVNGWDEASGSQFSLPWTHDMAAQTDNVYTGWFSVVAVGSVRNEDGFKQPKTSTRMMMSCFATSGYYSGFSGRRDVWSKPVTIDGHQGWHMRSEIYVEMKNLPQVKGDVVDVLAVDTGKDGQLSMFISSFTIDDKPREAQVDAAIASLRVEG